MSHFEIQTRPRDIMDPAVTEEDQVRWVVYDNENEHVVAVADNKYEIGLKKRIQQLKAKIEFVEKQLGIGDIRDLNYLDVELTPKYDARTQS